MPLIYGEGKDNAFKRLREETEKASKGELCSAIAGAKLLRITGTYREDFSVAFSLSDVSDVEHFVGRKEELEEIHGTLNGDSGRRTSVLYGLGGIGKT
jgi:hypothetical protein